MEDEATQQGSDVVSSVPRMLRRLLQEPLDIVPIYRTTSPTAPSASLYPIPAASSAATPIAISSTTPETAYAYDSQLIATQQVIDPRRLGQVNSGLSDEDLADIFCILHPASLPAYRAATLIHEYTPHHTISTQSDVKIREKNGDTGHQIGSFDLAAEGLTSCDIVLRLSTNVKNSLDGYRFGRNKQRCDFVLGQDEEVKRVSNVHFRIYINEYGVIMLEDQSTNGTAVNGVLLRAKEKENGAAHRHTLEQGSVIVLAMTPPEEDFRFFVRIPQRDEESENAYRANLTNYFNRMHNANLERRGQRRVTGAAAGNREPVS